MQLKGARLALLEELPESRHLNASQLKKIIGTDKLTGRYLYEGRMPWPVRSHVSHAAEPKATTATSTRMTTTNPENPTNSYSAPSESTLRLVYVWSPIGSKVLDRGGGGLGFGTISLSEVGIGAIGQGDAPSGETLDGCPSVTGMCLYGTQLARCRLI
jgi:hypothetical protein